MQLDGGEFLDNQVQPVGLGQVGDLVERRTFGEKCSM
jgi:hypothetical protein